jgi:hypothetical protein
MVEGKTVVVVLLTIHRIYHKFYRQLLNQRWMHNTYKLQGNMHNTNRQLHIFQHKNIGYIPY